MAKKRVRQIDNLVELFNPKMKSKNKLNRKDLDRIFEAVELISKNVKYEIPNSATFAMAIDAIEGNGCIFVIKNAKPTYAEEPKLVAIKEGS